MHCQEAEGMQGPRVQDSLVLSASRYMRIESLAWECGSPFLFYRLRIIRRTPHFDAAQHGVLHDSFAESSILGLEFRTLGSWLSNKRAQNRPSLSQELHSRYHSKETVARTRKSRLLTLNLHKARHKSQYRANSSWLRALLQTGASSVELLKQLSDRAGI